MQPLSVSATPLIGEKILRSHWSDEESVQNQSRNLLSSGLHRKATTKSNLSIRSAASSLAVAAKPDRPSSPRLNSPRTPRPIPAPDPIITISTATNSNTTSPKDRQRVLSHGADSSASFVTAGDDDLEEEPDYVTVEHPSAEETENNAVATRPDKASRVLGIRHRRSMEPIPASNRTSLASARSAPAPSVSAPPPPPAGPTLPLASLYVVSGLPKSPQTWTLADPDSVLGLHHSEGAVGRWWRPEVLGSTVSPGAGGGKRKKKGKTDESSSMFSSSGQLSKQEVGKMLSKALKV